MLPASSREGPFLRMGCSSANTIGCGPYAAASLQQCTLGVASMCGQRETTLPLPRATSCTRNGGALQVAACCKWERGEFSWWVERWRGKRGDARVRQASYLPDYPMDRHEAHPAFPPATWGGGGRSAHRDPKGCKAPIRTSVCGLRGGGGESRLRVAAWTWGQRMHPDPRGTSADMRA